MQHIHVPCTPRKEMMMTKWACIYYKEPGHEFKNVKLTILSKVQCIMHVGESIDNARKWNHLVIVQLELIKIAKRKCPFFLLNLASCFMVPSFDQDRYQRPWGPCWNVSRYGHKYEMSI
jgi:hypothetical protein